MFFRQFLDERLAQYAYLIGCPRTGEALVIDPERDVDRYAETAAKEELEIVAVADTHIHADYVTGIREFAERYGTKIYVSDEGGENWKYEWLIGSDYDYELLTDGDRFSIGNVEIRAVHTPGHTPEHLFYLVTDRGGGADEPMGVVTGDFVFVGDVGRPDLLESAAGVEGAMEPAARALFHSLDRFRDLSPEVQVWPGHGAGSVCGKALGAVPQSTVGYELKYNDSIARASSEDEFVEFILADQPEPPMYFARMKRVNREGPALLGEGPSPERLQVGDLGELAGRTDPAVVDTRSPGAFFGGHLSASLLAPRNRLFPTVVGSFVEEDVPIYLIVEEDELEETITDLIRIGLDEVVGYATPDTLERYATAGGALERTETVDFDTVEERLDAGEGTVLDVRGRSEFEKGHLRGALNLAHTRLYLEMDRLPRDRRLMVHCQTGARASVSTALLERNGFDVAFIDDSFPAYAERSDRIERGDAEPTAVS